MKPSKPDTRDLNTSFSQDTVRHFALLCHVVRRHRLPLFRPRVARTIAFCTLIADNNDTAAIPPINFFLRFKISFQMQLRLRASHMQARFRPAEAFGFETPWQRKNAVTRLTHLLRIEVFWALKRWACHASSSPASLVSTVRRNLAIPN